MVFVVLHISRAFHSFASLVRHKNISQCGPSPMFCSPGPISSNSPKTVQTANKGGNEKAVSPKCQSRIFQSHNLIYCSLSVLWHFMLSPVFVKFVFRRFCRSRLRSALSLTHSLRMHKPKVYLFVVGKSLSAIICVQPPQRGERERESERQRKMR